ncbi:MAG TPA: protein kinase [Polyangia bacterium]
MTLAPGTRIGPYEITAQLGAGGMGEVYEAQDARLGRRVAVKVLLESGRHDPERQRRFEAEARAVSALSHPNVVAVFDVGEHEGAPYLVSELLEGASLRDRLEGKPLPVRRAVDYAHQIAAGLAAAHDKGIIHRDLKPENVFVTRDGRLKILDFGIAKTIAGDVAGDGGTLPATAPGVVFGTAGYMAPEQVRGTAVDHRADVFSFGAILYEMLAGRRAFDGASPIEKAHAILTAEPAALPEGVALPPALEPILWRCLEKAPAERFQSARDLAFSLEALKETSGPAPAVAARRRRPAALVLLAGIVVGAAGGGTLAVLRRPARPAVVAPAPVVPHYRRVVYRRGWIENARFAPDGQTVVYGAGFESRPPQAFASIIGNPEARPLTGPDTGFYGISRTGEMALAIKAEDQHAKAPLLARAPLAGGAPREVAQHVVSADWSPDGGALMIVRWVGGGAGMRLEYPIGTTLYETAGAIASPRVSPRGDLIAFFDLPSVADTRGTLQVIDRQGARRSLSGPWGDQRGLAWSPRGDEVWFSAAKSGIANRLWAVPVAGGAERVVAEIPGTFTLQDVGRDGRVLMKRDDQRFRVSVLVPGETEPRDLSWFDGSVPTDLTRDGKKLLFVEGLDAAGGEAVSYLRPTDGAPAVRLGDGWAYALSPDGKWALQSPRFPYERLQLLPTGAGEIRPLAAGPFAEIRRAHFFPDGTRVVIVARAPKERFRLWLVDLADGGKARPLGDEGVEFAGDPVSPDGTRLAVTGPTAAPLFLDVASGVATPIPGLARGDVPVAFSDDGRSLFVAQPKRYAGLKLSRLDLASGRQTPVRVIPLAPDAVHVRTGFLTPDGRGYVVSYASMVSDLYLAEGLR